MSTATVNPRKKQTTRTFTVAALNAELGRRQNNKARPKGSKVKAKSFVFPALGSDHIAAIKNGKIVTVTFDTGSVEHIGLKAA